MRHPAIAVPPSFFGFVLTLLVATSPADGPLWAQQPVPVASEFQVNTYTTNEQARSSIAVDGSGNFVVVWQSYLQDGSLTGIFGQRFDSDGTPMGAEFQINTHTTGYQGNPRITMSNDGSFVVVWEDGDLFSDGQDGSRSGVLAQLFDNTGTGVGAEFQVNTYTTGGQHQHAVSMDSAGNFVVVWSDGDDFGDGQDGSSYGIFAQRYDSAGSPVGSEFQVNTYTNYKQRLPAVSMNAHGHFVIVWMGPDGAYEGIFGQRFDNTGVPQGGEFQVNTYTSSIENSPDVAMDSTGNFVVVWEGRHDGSRRGVFGQLFDSAGTLLGNEFQVNTYTPEFQLWPAVSMDDSSNFVVAWTSGNDDDPNSAQQDGSAYGNFGQRFDSSGTPTGMEFQINSFTLGDQAKPDIAMTGSGEFVVVWDSGPRFCTSCDQDGSSEGVFAQRFLPCAMPMERVPGFQVSTVNAGADLLFTWTDIPNADDYLVFEDSDAQDLFNTVTGSASSGSMGLTVPSPPGDQVYFLVAGRNASCGVGPKR